MVKIKGGRAGCLCIITALWAWGIGSLSGQTYITLNTVKARFLGLGGASVSLTDDLAALDANPAGFRLPVSNELTLHFFNNFVGSGAYLIEYQKAEDVLEPLGFFLKGAALSRGRFNMGLLIGEEALDDAERLQRKTVFDFTNYAASRNHTLGISFVLAPRVSVGVAAEMLTREGQEGFSYYYGYRYGLILKPREKISVGICYFDLPESQKTARRAYDRFCDESLNVGLSWEFSRRFRLAVDVRNVSDEGHATTREPHLGAEWALLPHLTVRSGCYWPREEQACYSLGAGLLEWNRLGRGNASLPYLSYALNAALLWREDLDMKKGTVVLGGLIRF